MAHSQCENKHNLKDFNKLKSHEIQATINQLLDMTRSLMNYMAALEEMLQTALEEYFDGTSPDADTPDGLARDAEVQLGIAVLQTWASLLQFCDKIGVLALGKGSAAVTLDPDDSETEQLAGLLATGDIMAKTLETIQDMSMAVTTHKLEAAYHSPSAKNES